MWSQSWVVTAPDSDAAVEKVQLALKEWTPPDQPPASIGDARIYRGPDDLSVTEAVSKALADIRQTVSQSHRRELSRRLHQLSQRPIGIPPAEGWVVLDGPIPRSPRPLDVRPGGGPRWVISVSWPGEVPATNDTSSSAE